MYDQHLQKYGQKCIMEAIQMEKKGTNLRDQIMKVYITFKTMDTKDLVLDQLFRSDSKMPK